MSLLRNACIKYFLAVYILAKLKTCSKGSSASLYNRRTLHYLNLKCPTNFNFVLGQRQEAHKRNEQPTFSFLGAEGSSKFAKQDRLPL